MREGTHTRIHAVSTAHRASHNARVLGEKWGAWPWDSSLHRQAASPARTPELSSAPRHGQSSQDLSESRHPHSHSEGSFLGFFAGVALMQTAGVSPSHPGLFSSSHPCLSQIPFHPPPLLTPKPVSPLFKAKHSFLITGGSLAGPHEHICCQQTGVPRLSVPLATPAFLRAPHPPP